MLTIDQISDDGVIFIGDILEYDIRHARKALGLTKAEIKAFLSALKRKDAAKVRAMLSRLQKLTAEQSTDNFNSEKEARP